MYLEARNMPPKAVECHLFGTHGWVAVVVILLIAVIAVKYESTHSLSYRDGYAIGQKLEVNLASGTSFCNLETQCINQAQQLQSESTTAKCNTVVQSPNVLPNGDSESQWLTGCVAGFDAATHPGNSSP
jgi:hypothetical protein